jgi:glycopeptide antibiotics resistance protein
VNALDPLSLLLPFTFCLLTSAMRLSWLDLLLWLAAVILLIPILMRVVEIALEALPD